MRGTSSTDRHINFAYAECLDVRKGDRGKDGVNQGFWANTAVGCRETAGVEGDGLDSGG